MKKTIIILNIVIKLIFKFYKTEIIILEQNLQNNLKDNIT